MVSIFTQVFCPVERNWSGSVAKGMEKLFIRHIKEHPEESDTQD
jgi:hypothetical protein